MLLHVNNLTLEGRLSSFSSSVLAGQKVHILGANGAGKSSLLSSLSGLINITGDVILNGCNLRTLRLSELAHQRAYLSQSQAPLSVIPVFQYLSLHLSGTASPSNEKQMYAICVRLGLAHQLEKTINQLSGGEWQRVRLAAVLGQIWPGSSSLSPLLLLDEPATALDVRYQLALDALLHEFCLLGGSVIMSAHDINHSYMEADVVWLFKQGRCLYQGEPAQIMTVSSLREIYDVEFQCIEFNNHVWFVPKKSMDCDF